MSLLALMNHGISLKHGKCIYLQSIYVLLSSTNETTDVLVGGHPISWNQGYLSISTDIEYINMVQMNKNVRRSFAIYPFSRATTRTNYLTTYMFVGYTTNISHSTIHDSLGSFTELVCIGIKTYDSDSFLLITDMFRVTLISMYLCSKAFVYLCRYIH